VLWFAVWIEVGVKAAIDVCGSGGGGGGDEKIDVDAGDTGEKAACFAFCMSFSLS